MPNITMGLTLNGEGATVLILGIFLILSVLFIYILDRSAPPGCYKVFGKNED